MDSDLTAPMRFAPFLRPMVWGGRRLATVLHKALPTDAPYGESWEVSDHPLHRSVLSGVHAGRSLRALMETAAVALLGRAAPAHATFPWLIKFLDAHDWLSVQVHPNEGAVRRLCPGEGSKTEAWFVLDTLPESRIFAGLLPGVDERGLRAALATGKVAECLHSFVPRPGDCVFLPAGTVHAVGGGVLLAEVQQTSDATFRLFDWNRGRPLHVEEALACIDWSQGPVQPVRATPGVPQQELVRCPCFTLEHLTGASCNLGGIGTLQALIVLHGHARLHARGQDELGPGQVRLLPAALPEVRLEMAPAFRALLCSLPS
jgi:mannose-6-phosphate isomerase